MIGIITYDRSHKKTQDILTRIFLTTSYNVKIFILPWVERENYQPIWKHRPEVNFDAGPDLLAKKFGYETVRVNTDDLSKDEVCEGVKLFVIAGAGILPAEFVKNQTVINSHPGYLPFSKGLDASKWALFNGMPLGVTAHIVNEKADEGKLICQEIVPVYFEDTFHGTMQRVYEYEIRLLILAIDMIHSSVSEWKLLDDSNYSPTRRMPHSYEIIMFERYNELRRKSRSQWSKK